MWPLFLLRRRPTLPHSFPCSTIGPARLNCRVRDGNGCDPRGMITGNLALSTQPWALSPSQDERLESSQCAASVRFYRVSPRKGPFTAEGSKLEPFCG